MNPNVPTYVQIIAENYPNLGVGAVGDGTEYDTLVVQPPGVLPPKADLDALVKTGTVDRMWQLIQDERDRRTETGGFRVGVNWYHSDATSRMQQIALTVYGNALPAGIQWKTMSGVFVTMTTSLAQQIFRAAVAAEQAVFAAAEAHRVAMAASSAPETYDFGVGWPLTYDEATQ